MNLKYQNVKIPISVMRFSAERRLLILGGAAFLADCKPNRQTPPSRSELEAQGVITPPANSPDTRLGNPRVTNAPTAAPVIWDLEFFDEIGIRIRAKAAEGGKGIAYDGLLQVGIPTRLLQAGIDFVSPSSIVDTQSEDLNTVISLSGLETGKQFFDSIIQLGATRPASLISERRVVLNLKEAPNAWLITNSYRNKLFIGSTILTAI